ncbi:hypothetical protein [Subtercola vilae]|uniref:FtsK domain-containing protein n=1 Tax=Subtercola vilae TaxID=2056433 RepID=A0A4T2BBY4_9MICO|nr:hypothetical protein [Subtercola vilae]TIH28783.1 hypothetical protein D4765_18265 [Subtercola vilae]
MFDRIVSSHNLIPRLTDTDFWRLPIGLGLRNQQIGSDIRASSPVGVFGLKGSGKTNALLQLIVSALTRGIRVVVIDRQDHGEKYLGLLPYLECLAVDDYALAVTLLLIHTKMLERTRACVRHDVDNVDDLPKSKKESVHTEPILIVIDGVEAISSQFQAAVSELMSDPLLSSLNIFVAFSVAEPWKSTSREARRNMGDVLALKPPLSPDDVTEMFPDRPAEVSYAKAGLAYEAAGFGLYQSIDGNTRGVEISDTGASDLPAILASFRVPQPEHWDVIRSEVDWRW